MLVEISSKLNTEIIEKLDIELLHKMCFLMSPELKAKFTKCAFIVAWLINCKKAKDYYE